MKRLLIVGIALFSTSLFAQNQIPVVSNVQFEVTDTVINRNYITTQIKVTYDVIDAENDPMTVSLRVSRDFGNNFSVVPLVVTGDVGSGVTSGTGKTIIWRPTPTRQVADAADYVYRIIADDGQQINIADIVSQVDSNKIKSVFNTLYGTTNNHVFNPTQLNNSRNFIQNYYLSNGYTLHTDNFVCNDRNNPEVLKNGINYVGIQEGLLSDSAILMSAHYDNIDTTRGADDNNIAQACMLVAAELAKDYQYKNRTIFGSWDFEEDGLVGAYFYSLQPQAKKIKAVINFDGIGIYKTAPNSQRVPTGFEALFPLAYTKVMLNDFKGDFIAMIGDAQSAALVQDAIAASQQYAPDLNYVDVTCPDPGCQIAKDLRRSDHAPFWDQNIPSVFYTATTQFRSECYHMPCDTVVNFWFAYNVIKSALGLYLEKAAPMHAGFAQSATTSSVTTINTALTLSAPFPNPITQHAYLQVNLPETDVLTVKAYNLQGKEVDNVFTGKLLTGKHTLLWDVLPNLPDGMYIIKASSEKGFSQSYKVTVNLAAEQLHQH